MMSSDLTSKPANQKVMSHEGGRLSKDKSKSDIDTAGEDGGGFSSLLMSISAQESPALDASIPAIAPSDPAALSEKSKSQTDTDSDKAGFDATLASLVPVPTDLPASAILDPSLLVPGTAPEHRPELGGQDRVRKARVDGLGDALPAISKDDKKDTQPLVSKNLAMTEEPLSSPPTTAQGGRGWADLKKAELLKDKTTELEAMDDQRVDMPLKSEKETMLDGSKLTPELLMDKTVHTTPLRGEDGVQGHQFASTVSRFEDSPVMQTGPAMSLERDVANQVSYWIGQNVQSAELKLDGLGQSPVEVSISMQGKEAHVEFRSDQVETRQLIEEAMPHLKELLKGEGLVLAGVAIGAAASDGASSQERKPKQHQQRESAARSALRLAEVGNGIRASTGRTLDLFV